MWKPTPLSFLKKSSWSGIEGMWVRSKCVRDGESRKRWRKWRNNTIWTLNFLGYRHFLTKKEKGRLQMWSSRKNNNEYLWNIPHPRQGNSSLIEIIIVIYIYTHKRLGCPTVKFSWSCVCVQVRCTAMLHSMAGDAGTTRSLVASLSSRVLSSLTTATVCYHSFFKSIPIKFHN